MKRYERCIAVLIVVILLAAVIVQRPSVVSGLDTKAPESIVSHDPDSLLPMINTNRVSDLVGVQGWRYGSLGGIAPGDLVVRTQTFYHTMPVSAVVDKHGTPSTTELDEIYVSSHTDPAYDARLIDFMPSIIGHPEYCDFVSISIFKAP